MLYISENNLGSNNRHLVSQSLKARFNPSIRHLKAASVLMASIALVACGGGGGTATPAETTTPVVSGFTVTPGVTPSTGKLIPEVRQSGHEDLYLSDPTHKQRTDAIITATKDAVTDLQSAFKWPSDVPVVFSGCGQVNAFFGTLSGTNFGVHDVLAQFGVADPSLEFGTNITGSNVLIMCHELTEKATQVFFNDSEVQTTINGLVQEIEEATPTADQIATFQNLSAFMFELQVLLHEIGHGLDTVFLKDSANNAIKTENFSIPLINTCSEPACDTLSEDFADWISAAIIIDVLKDEILTDTDNASNLAGAWLVALEAWPSVFAAGGDAAHGFTKSRQANMLCYAYGAIPELRGADVSVLDSGLKQFMIDQGIPDPEAQCQTIFDKNNSSSDRLLTPFMS